MELLSNKKEKDDKSEVGISKVEEPPQEQTSEQNFNLFNQINQEVFTPENNLVLYKNNTIDEKQTAKDKERSEE